MKLFARVQTCEIDHSTHVEIRFRAALETHVRLTSWSPITFMTWLAREWRTDQDIAQLDLAVLVLEERDNYTIFGSARDGTGN
jgi:hypothetical protein